MNFRVFQMHFVIWGSLICLAFIVPHGCLVELKKSKNNPLKRNFIDKTQGEIFIREISKDDNSFMKFKNAKI